jgi:outer membrane protein OmpA-like peptidoglycan-associated protein
MTLRGAILGAGLLALPIAASAQPVNGFYVSLGAGVNLMQDQTFRFSNSNPFGPTGPGPGAHLKSTVGPAVVGSVGYGFGFGLRAELEGDWMNNKFNGVNSSIGSFRAGGWEQKYGVMANLLYDFTMVPYVQPYIGGGVGYQWANLNNFRINGGGEQLGLGGTDGSFAYQAIVGLAIPVPPAPGLAITAEYRFLGLTGSHKYDGELTGAGTLSGPVSASVRNNYNHMFLVGFRYNFGQVPPPPPPAPVAAPAPAVQPARSYLVFFDWDKATLTGRARQIIREAAEASTHVQVTRIDVNGHTDTTGSAQYNKGLSIRRASAVKAELIRNGVPANVIYTQGFGFSELLVPTGPGVREPQNRRVEIILH